MNNKAIIAMSGGVDSSVASFLMQEQGYELLGVTLALIDSDSQDIEDAKKVADRLGFSHTVLNFKDECLK